VQRSPWQEDWSEVVGELVLKVGIAAFDGADPD
jgi:hypothetical protein